MEEGPIPTTDLSQETDDLSKTITLFVWVELEEATHRLVARSVLSATERAREEQGLMAH